MMPNGQSALKTGATVIMANGGLIVFVASCFQSNPYGMVLGATSFFTAQYLSRQKQEEKSVVG